MAAPLAPGLQVHVDDDPLARAGRLAGELDADLCTTVQDAEDLLTRLAEFPPLTEEEIRLVERSSERVAAAHRIVERSLDRAAHDVSGRLAAVGTGVAIHPTAVRQRAAAVLAARDALGAAKERLETARADAEAEEAAALARVGNMTAGSSGGAIDDEPAPKRRRFGFTRRGRARRYEEDTSESTSLLQQVAAATDEAFGARRATEARSGLLLLLEVQRARAEEDVRVAERSWSDMAGSDSVEDVERVVQRIDPQYQSAREVAQDAAGVRAAATLVDRATQRWDETWRSLGYPAPDLEEADWVTRMADRLTRAVVLVAGAVDVSDRLVAAAPAAPVLVVKPAS